ncbi:MAG: response regulator [Elusimicrobia bacterium]|nr:response regulator [Elusimicrobiota bacterium]
MKKILVVDDDRVMVEFMVECLQRGGYRVDTAYNGVEGLAKAREVKPDLLILDLMMPDMHGFDVCEALRQKDSDFSGKILISSGKAYEVDKKAARRMGADQYLVKPFTFEELNAAVSGLLGR